MKSILIWVLVIVVHGYSAAWKTREVWTSEWEKRFSESIEKQTYTTFCTSKNLYSYCSATVYQIRASFAAQHGLPFAIYDRTQQRYFNNESPGPWDNVSTDSQDEKLLLFLKTISEKFLAHTSSLVKDTYPVKLSSLRAGDILLLKGHATYIHRIRPNGLMDIMYTGLSDDPQELFEHPMVEVYKPECGEERGCGFRRFIPLGLPAAETQGYQTLNSTSQPDFSYLKDYVPMSQQSGDFDPTQGYYFLWLAEKIKTTSGEIIKFDDVANEILNFALSYLSSRNSLTSKVEALRRLNKTENALKVLKWERRNAEIEIANIRASMNYNNAQIRYNQASIDFIRNQMKGDAPQAPSKPKIYKYEPRPKPLVFKLTGYEHDALSTPERDLRVAWMFQVLFFLAERDGYAPDDVLRLIKSEKTVTVDIDLEKKVKIPLRALIFFVLANDTKGCETDRPFFSSDANSPLFLRWPLKENSTVLEPSEYPACASTLKIDFQMF